MIFNGEMVRAILDGRKTQTRRIMKVQPSDSFHPTHNGYDLDLNAHRYTPGVVDKKGYLQPAKKDVFGVADENEGFTCPFGAIGDRIWVRETFSCIGNEDGHPVDADGNLCSREDAQRIYRASAIQKPGNYGIWTSADDFDFEGAWTPSIHMPRWASRLTLEITGVRMERLASVSDEDAGKEGYPANPAPYGGTMDKWLWFRGLWDSIYPDQSFKHNPWVWVIEFKVVPNVQDNPA